MGNCLPTSKPTLKPHPTDPTEKPPGKVAPVLPHDQLVKKGKFNPEEWQRPQVICWLSYIGLSQYAKYFEEAGMPGSILMTIQPDTIQNDLKITDPNHQLSLMRAIDLLKEQPEIDYEKWRWSINGVCEWLKTRGLSNYIPYIKQYAIHGALLFSLNEDDFKQRYKFDTDNGSEMHWKSLLSAINYEKKKAKDQSSRFHFATNIREDGTFGNDGGQIAVVQTEDPLANEDKKNIVPEWTVDQVALWLNDLYLGHLRNQFIENAVHGAFLLELDKDTLEKGLGLTSIQSQVVYSHLQKLKDAYEHGQEIPLGTNKESPKEHAAEAVNKTIIDEDDEAELSQLGELPENLKFKKLPDKRYTIA